MLGTNQQQLIRAAIPLVMSCTIKGVNGKIPALS